MNTSGKKGAQRLIPDMETFAETVAHGFAVGSTTASMKNVDSAFHVTGRSIYLDDIPVQQGTLYALPYDAPSAHAHVKKLDLSKALTVPGVVRILTYKDVPGENQIGGIIPDEPLFAEDEIHFWGMPVALIVATSEDVARQARALVNIELEELPVITDPREARAKGELIIPPRRFQLGDTQKAWDKCAHIFEGRADTNGQEHLYIETQGAYAYPTEHGSVRISSSTQGPTAVQKTVARVLGVPMHKIEVDVTRLGGGFGGKEDQASAWAALVAMAAFVMKKPIKFSMHRMDDMRMTGKRHPYSSDFKIGFDKDLKIVVYEATFHQNAGASADLSPAVMERTLFHATNAYHVPNVDVTAYCCRTNLPPNTAFRGFGGPQGMFVMEAAIAKAAQTLGVSAREIQKRNLIKEGSEFSYGQIADHVLAKEAWELAEKTFDFDKQQAEIDAFNVKSETHKKGMAIMPICFGISFTNTPMNHARALVHVYQDGSVGVSTGGVEMGQGLNTKMVQVASAAFGIGVERIKLESTNTTRVANTSPSAASATADLNGKALEIGCNAILERIKEKASRILTSKPEAITIENEAVLNNGKATDLDWKNLIHLCHWDRVNLSESGHYATPNIHFDKTKEKGHPFAYHVYGTAAVMVTVDCIRGTYVTDAVKLVHDFGKRMNDAVDIGQIEGGVVQGLGWMTMEEIVYNDKGRLLSNALSTYKIPDIHSVPKELIIEALPTDGHPLAIRRSKAVGEPPLMYGIGVYFAIENAVRAFNPKYVAKYDAPFTPEKVLMSLYT
ncbi:MAG TPA: molybdopterin-dependent oxidoreductase [Flavobacteriales bacterium]|jgi:xanthine dehydrogenase large subunit|nr:molybdopterin-dependent oxidoreductase [Flavobacteriales bacterium]HQX30372.1 molybdopterin-dependent oxidoreductase [Flavobacteriales bacterium]HQX39471.1 molybdopterin-dependent oxidoreductase [Flavobacteriales bacterium]